jgi:hypothetical protein
MLTKTLRFDDDVLSIVRGMNWSDDGRLGVLTCGQLDRKMYEKVNKALDAMGGKWNRGKGGHVFAIDPRPSVEGLLTNGALQIERDGFFETPEKVVKRMIELAGGHIYGDVLEPSAGMGAIVKHIDMTNTDHVVLVEKNEQRAEYLDKTYGDYCMVFNMDFIDFDIHPFSFWRSGGFDFVLMNPPFEDSQDIMHIVKAWQLLKPGGKLISVVSEGPFFRQDIRAINFRRFVGENEAHTEKLPEGSFKESGTGVNTRLVVFSK